MNLHMPLLPLFFQTVLLIRLVMLTTITELALVHIFRHQLLAH
jgi:hypothetical protein